MVILWSAQFYTFFTYDMEKSIAPLTLKYMLNKGLRKREILCTMLLIKACNRGIFVTQDDFLEFYTPFWDQNTN